MSRLKLSFFFFFFSNSSWLSSRGLWQQAEDWQCGRRRNRSQGWFIRCWFIIRCWFMCPWTREDLQVASSRRTQPRQLLHLNDLTHCCPKCRLTWFQQQFKKDTQPKCGEISTSLKPQMLLSTCLLWILSVSPLPLFLPLPQFMSLTSYDLGFGGMHYRAYGNSLIRDWTHASCKGNSES